VAKVTNNTGRRFRGTYLTLLQGESVDLPTEVALNYYGLLTVEFTSDDNLENIHDGHRRVLTKALGPDFAKELIPKKTGLSRAKKSAKQVVEAIMPEAPAEPEAPVETTE